MYTFDISEFALDFNDASGLGEFVGQLPDPEDCE